jgi:hypothetical protein
MHARVHVCACVFVRVHDHESTHCKCALRVRGYTQGQRQTHLYLHRGLSPSLCIPLLLLQVRDPPSRDPSTRTRLYLRRRCSLAVALCPRQHRTPLRLLRTARLDVLMQTGLQIGAASRYT